MYQYLINLPLETKAIKKISLTGKLLIGFRPEDRVRRKSKALSVRKLTPDTASERRYLLHQLEGTSETPHRS